MDVLAGIQYAISNSERYSILMTFASFKPKSTNRKSHSLAFLSLLLYIYCLTPYFYQLDVFYTRNKQELNATLH
mgnify:CR=1 FL=1|jgi:hypothetical protein